MAIASYEIICRGKKDESLAKMILHIIAGVELSGFMRASSIILTD